MKPVVKNSSSQSANILQKKKEAKSAEAKVERLWIVEGQVNSGRDHYSNEVIQRDLYIADLPGTKVLANLICNN
jgi:hypothetical protein